MSWLFSALPKLNFSTIVDVLLVAFLVYQFLMIVRGRRAFHILIGLGVLVAVYVMAQRAGLELLSSVLELLAPYTAFALIVMFQSDIRRLLARLGRRRFVGFGGQLQRRDFVEDVLLALAALHQSKTGALIVVEGHIGLRTFIESGVALDAHLSRDLLLAIFWKGSALHDGAVIMQRDRIAAAACFLPLSMNPMIARKLGTRHRAAIGITEETDCLSLIVSEETGRLSVASGGEIETNLTLDDVADRIGAHFGVKSKPRRSPAVPAPPQAERRALEQ